MPQAVKVGIFMTAALVLLGWLILRVEDWDLFGAKGRRVDAVFDSIEGLDDKAAVRVAGVRVGRVDGIRLDGAKARVTLLLETDVALAEGAQAAIANLGLLGDKYVQLEPGPAGAPPLPDGAVLPGRSPVSLDRAMAKLEKIGDSVESLLSGQGGGAFGDLVDSIRATSDELRAVIAENRRSFGGTVANFERFSATLADDLPRLTRQIEQVLAQVESVVGENRGDLRESMANLREVTDRVQVSVDNLNEITGKITRGEGTIGKLVNSDEAHDELMSALGSVEKGVGALGDAVERANRLGLELGLESWYLAESEESQATFRLDLLPRGVESPHRYRFDLVATPRGRVYEKLETVTVTNPDGTVETTVTSSLTRDESRNSYSALVGFPFAARRGTLWAGLIENSGGVEVEYSLVPERFWLSLSAFDFSREQDLDPHLRLSATWFPWKHVYLRAGYDDPLVDEFDSAFVGGGLRWSDDDLKYLAGSIPKL
ncbi:MAG: MCE family protein [Thermoanaerobaculia bacterium]|nr:MAG: MCE family protein [Thermoanaerobaculia bacterium]